MPTSCDNLPTNGHKLKAAVVALAARQDAALAEWINAVLLKGHETVEQAIADPKLAAFIHAYMHEDIDPLAPELAALGASLRDEPGDVLQLLRVGGIWPAQVAHDARVHAALEPAYRHLLDRG